VQIVEGILVEHRCQQQAPASSRYIDGHDIMNLFGITPGPGLGRLLERVKEAQAAGEVTSREEAIELVRRSIASEG
jgi:hypothetical protein